MERVLTQEERIRRAEEIYLRRKNLQQPEYKIQNREVSTNRSEPIKSVKLFKRIFLQIVICLLLYCIFYLIYDTNFSFSNATITKTAEILNHDINIEEMYKSATAYFNSLIHSDEEKEIEQNNQVDEQVPQDNINETNSQEQQQEVIQPSDEPNVPTEVTPDTSATPTTPEEPMVEETQQTSAEEVNLKQLYALIRPIQRRIYFFRIW